MLQHMKMRAAMLSQENAAAVNQNINMQTKKTHSVDNFAELLLSLRQSKSTDSNFSTDTMTLEDSSVVVTPEYSPKASGTQSGGRDFSNQQYSQSLPASLPCFGGFSSGETDRESFGSSSSSAIKKLRTELASDQIAASSFDSYDVNAHDTELSRHKALRGKYKCSRCGVQKTNHVCPVREVLVCSAGTQVAPCQYSVEANTLIFRERTITVSGRKNI